MKLKLNWGTGIVLAFIAFISFILYFVITINTDAAYDHDLVTESYYKKELAFQKQLNKEQKSKDQGLGLLVSKTESGLEVSFPESLDASGISGSVFLYRPSDKRLDFEVPISLSGSSLLIPGQSLSGGRWNIEISWTYHNEEYFYQEAITF